MIIVIIVSCSSGLEYMYKITSSDVSGENCALGRYFFKEPFVIIPIRRMRGGRLCSGIRVHLIGTDEERDFCYMIDGSSGTLQLPGGKRDEGNVSTASEIVLPVLTNGTTVNGGQTFHLHVLLVSAQGVCQLCQAEIPNNGSSVSCKYSGDSTFLIRDAGWFYSAQLVLKPTLSIGFVPVAPLFWEIDQAQHQSGTRKSKIGFIEWDKTEPTQRMSLSLFLFT